MSIAVLDLGTNTFNLLIAERSESSGFRILHRSILPVKLGRGGINNHIILPDAIERAFISLNGHAATIEKYKPSEVFVFATSAFRSASNGKWLADEIKKRYGFSVNIIDGDTEAGLIYDGVAASLQNISGNFIILDIGGGSNEFIIGNKENIFWKKSFPIGIARLIEQFPPSDPVTLNEILQLKKYCDSSLKELSEAAALYMPKALIGASGAFDTIYSLIKTEMPEKYPDDTFSSRDITIDDFQTISEKIIHSKMAELGMMKGLEPARIEMIIYASIFIRYVLQKLSPGRLIQSEFSLKEGVMWRWANEKRII